MSISAFQSEELSVFVFQKNSILCRCEFSKVIQSQTFFSIFSSVQPAILFTHTSISDVILWQGVRGEGRGGGENVMKMSNNNNEPPDCGRHTEPLRRAAQESCSGEPGGHRALGDTSCTDV